MSAIQNLLGWTEVQLSEISYRITKGTTPTSVGFNFTENGILFVKVESLSEQRINHNLCAFISSEADEALARSRFKENDILFSIAGTLGRIAIVQAEDLPANTNQAICIIRLIPPIFPKYIAQILSSHLLEDRIKEQRRGVGLQNLNLRQVSEFTIPLPPLNEQKRIVAKIEALQERSQRVKAELVAIRPLLNKFRQSVLAAAFRGDLTKDWREKNPDIEPASVLLERIKIERRRRWEEAELEKMKAAGKTPKDDKWKQKYNEPEPVNSDNLPQLPDGWCWVNVETLGEVSGGLTKNSKRQSLPLEFPYLRVANVYANKLDLEDIKTIRIKSDEYTRVLSEKEDLLIVEGNGSIDQVGRVALWNGAISPCLHQNHLIKVRFSPTQIGKYVLRWLLSEQGRIYITKVASSTSGLYTLSLSKVSTLPIPIASLKEQQEIVNRIDKLFKIADNIEHLYQQTETDLETLNQSILAKAFRGELVPQNPNDEPASVLLERIRKERETDSKPAKQTRQKPPKTDNYNSTQLTLEGIE